MQKLRNEEGFVGEMSRVLLWAGTHCKKCEGGLVNEVAKNPPFHQLIRRINKKKRQNVVELFVKI